MTQLAVKKAGSWLPTLPWGRGGGVWKPAINAYVRLAGVWTQFFQAFSASADSSSLVEIGSTATLTTAAATITPSGGSAPYTYAWTRHSGDAGITINSPTGASTTFYATLALGARVDGIFYCTVTDANGHTVVVAVAVHIERTV